MAWVSILTMYNNYPDIFDDIALPDGVDKDLLINSIITELAEMDLLYSNPIVLKPLISVWSQKELWNWEKLYKTTTFDYDPIVNYDRMETETTNNERTNTASGTQDNTTTNDLTAASENIHKVAGYDSANMVTSESDSGTIDNTGTVTNNMITSSTNNGTDNGSRTLKIKGNIGVTTTQQMIEEERKVSKFNIYDYIVKSFKRRFCIMLY